MNREQILAEIKKLSEEIHKIDVEATANINLRIGRIQVYEELLQALTEQSVNE